MGTCGSKCCFESPSPSITTSDPGSPHDKAVISSDPLPFTMPPPPPKDPFSESPKFHSKFQIYPYPAIPFSSSSCTPPASSSISMTTSTTTTTTTTSSYSSSSSFYSTTTNSTEISSDSRSMDSYSTCRPAKKKSFSNEFLWSCAENSNIVILDPTKAIKQKPVESQISEISTTPSQYLSAATTMTRGITTSSLRQRTNSTATMRNNQSNNAKRERSVSPASRTGRKAIKPDPGLWNPVSSNSTRPRTRDLQPPQWRPVNSQRESFNALTGPVSRPDSAVKRDWKGPTMEKEAKQRQIQDGEVEVEVEVISRERVKTPPPLVEDLNNPLIAMDCFIFL